MATEPTKTKSEPKETVIMTQSLVGPKTSVHFGDPYECGAAEAGRLVDAGFARRPKTEA